jgi:diguanylate cyclase (GGDEF)-like protein/PAS domain S-box-containing protein
LAVVALSREGLHLSLIEQALPDALFVHDHEGRFVEVNRRACESLGYTREELLAMRVTDIEQDFDLPAAQAQWSRLRPDATIALKGHQRRRDGSRFPVEVHFGLLEADGQRLYVGVVRDISEREAQSQAWQEANQRLLALERAASQRAARLLRRNEQQYQGIVQAMSEGLVLQDAVGQVIAANPAAEAILGRSLNRLASRPHRQPWQGAVREDGTPYQEEAFPAMVALATGETVRNAVVGFGPADADQRWITVNAVPLCLGESTRPDAVLSTFSDIAFRKRLEQNLRASEAFTQTILNSLPEHIVVLDRHGVITAVNRSWERFALLNGAPAHTANPVGLNYKAICLAAVGEPFGEEAGPAWAGIEAVLTGEAAHFSLEYPCDSPDEPRWFTMDVFPMVAPAQGVVIAHANITSRKLAETRLAFEHTQLRTLLETIPDLVWLKNPDGVYLACNPAFERFLGVTQAQLLGKTDHELMPPEAAEVYRRSDLAAIAAGGPVVSEQWASALGGDKRSLFEVTKTPMRDRDGALIGVLGIGHDVTQRQRMLEQIQEFALRDALTKLANRRVLYDRLDQVLAACKRKGHFAALMLIDLDNFKPLNDRHGHFVGDLLLVEAAARLTRCVRETDTVARFGGDEFVVLLTELTHRRAQALAQAEVVAQKLCAALSEPYVLNPADGAAGPPEPVLHRCSASIGVVILGGHEGNVQEAIRRADVAMYQAKGSGRNRVSYFEAPSSRAEGRQVPGMDAPTLRLKRSDHGRTQIE